MKTINVMKFGKGYYVSARLGSRMVSHEYFKTKKATMERVNNLKKEGYTIQ